MTEPLEIKFAVKNLTKGLDYIIKKGLPAREKYQYKDLKNKKIYKSTVKYIENFNKINDFLNDKENIELDYTYYEVINMKSTMISAPEKKRFFPKIR